MHTLCAVDVATSWVELQALWGKGHSRVAAGVQAVRERLPVPRVGLDSDNGSEFINRVLYYYCWREGITFTRGRAWKKNDSALVEQKNGAVVRHLVGYDRFTSKPALAQLARVYALARLHVNFFQPVEKLVTKHRVGARVHRVFDRAQTPYQRVCAAGVLSPPRPFSTTASMTRSNQGTWFSWINPAGQIAGGYIDAGDGAHGFLRTRDGTIVTFDVPGSVRTYVFGINPVGQIVGTYIVGTYNAAHGFVRNPDGTIVTFDVPGSVFTWVSDINPAGQIVGFYVDAGGVAHGFVSSRH